MPYSLTMFDRRNKPSWGQAVAEFFWPRAGWHRSSRYLFHRLARMSGTPYSLAAGFACGAAVSFTPFVGFHFVLAALLALAIRGNILASAIGTAVGNPWTFPFIWLWIYEVGRWLGAGGPAEHAASLNFGKVFGNMLKATLDLDARYLIEVAWPVWWPMFVGGIPTAILVWFAFYLPLRPTIEGYRKRRIQRRLRKKRSETLQELEQ